MKTIKIVSIPLDMKEVRVATEDGIQALALALGKPILRLDNAVQYHLGIAVSDPHSFLAIVSDGVVYKWMRKAKVKNDGQDKAN